MKNQLKTVFLLTALSAVLVASGGMLGPGYLYGFTALAILMNLGAYFFSDRLVLALHHAQEVLPEPATASLFIVSPFAGRGGLSSLFSTHPAVEDRIRRLAAMARNPQAAIA